jgi:hypothetical protein
MNALTQPEDGPPCVQPPEPPSAPRQRVFLGAADLAPGKAIIANRCLSDGARAIAEARRLIALGRNEDARFELSEAARCIKHAARWAELDLS